MKKGLKYSLLILSFIIVLSIGVYAGTIIDASEIKFNSTKTDATTVEEAINELYDDYNNRINYLIKDGVTNVDFGFTTDNTTSYIKNENGYIHIYDGGYYLNSSYHTENKIDLTNYNFIIVKGYVDSTNSNAIYVSNYYNYTYNNSSVSAVASSALSTTNGYYMLDISNISGEYYVGIVSSNRHDYIYDMWLF